MIEVWRCDIQIKGLRSSKKCDVNMQQSNNSIHQHPLSEKFIKFFEFL